MKKNNFKNILLINYGGIGDEILFLPVISSLKKSFPNSKITLGLEPRSKSIKNLTCDLDDVILIDIKAKGIKKYLNILKFIFKTWFKNFDIVISSGKSPFVAIILFLTGIKRRIGYDSKTDFLLTDRIKLVENQYAAKMYYDLISTVSNIPFENPKIKIPEGLELDKKFKKNEYIALHPGVSKMSVLKNIIKCPNSAFRKTLIKGFLLKGRQVVLLGTNDDKEIIDEIIKDNEISSDKNFINYFNKTKNIMEMAYIMKNSAYVICVDSAPLHVAVGVEAKIFSIFAPTNEQKLTPKNMEIEIITNNCNCRPCLWHKRSQNCDNPVCLDIDPDLILNKI